MHVYVSVQHGRVSLYTGTSFQLNPWSGDSHKDDPASGHQLHYKIKTDFLTNLLSDIYGLRDQTL